MLNTIWVVSLVVLLSYGLRKVGVPIILQCHQLEPKALHWKYPLFESMSLLCLAPFLYDTHIFVSILIAVFMMALLTLAFIDIEYFILPDIITMPLLMMGLIVSAYLEWFVEWRLAILSSLAAYFSLRLFADIYYYFTGRIGIGRGDIKLFSAFGAWFGVYALPFILWTASCVGLLWALVIFGLKRLSYNTLIPFGPFLVFGAWCYLLLAKYVI